MYDIIIIGAGPAGLTAGLYARRANKSVLIIEKGAFGGQITFSPKVENIPGFCELSGNEFAEKLVEQVINQGADFECAEVTSVTGDAVKTVIADGVEYQAKAVIVATGAKHRMLGIEGEERLVGNGISFCAVCDGAFYKDKKVGVVGGGNSALQEAILLSDLASEVTVIQNLDYLTGEKKLVNQLYQKKNVTVVTGATVTGFEGEDELTAVNIVANGEERRIEVDGLFVAIGLIPQNESFANILPLDERGYAIADEKCLGKIPGVFVAGDCRTKSIRQVATACSDGAIAALAACDYIDGLR